VAFVFHFTRCLHLTVKYSWILDVSHIKMGMTREDYGKCGAEGTGVVIGQIDHDMIFINVFFVLL